LNNIIKINNLSTYYGNKQILKDITLQFEKNKITSIIGPSGCGKSTLLKSLNALSFEEFNFKYSGNIYFNNQDIKEIPKELLRKNIGIVFQQPTCFPFSVHKNLAYALKYHTNLTKSEIDNIIIDNLKITGLYDEISENLKISAHKLSGGQQQRLCISRALSINPQVLLLDEPCSALDIINTNIIEELLKKLSKIYTIIIVTHNLNQAKRISDKTAFLLNGEIIEYGNTSQIFNNPKNESTNNYINGIYG